MIITCVIYSRLQNINTLLIFLIGFYCCVQKFTWMYPCHISEMFVYFVENVFIV